MAQKRKLIAKKSTLETVLIWGVVLVFLVLPLLYFPGRIASYVTSKQYFMGGIVDVLTVLWIWLLLVDSRYRLSKRNVWFLLPAGLFLLSMTISGLVGVDPATSFFSIVESGTGLILLYHIFLFACITASLLRVHQRRLLQSILQANLIASVILAIATFLTGGNGVLDIHSQMLDMSSGGAMMGNSLLVGAYFIFSIFLTLYLIVHESRTWQKVWYWCGIGMMVLSPIYFNAAIFKGTDVSSAYLFIGEARIATIALVSGLILAFFIWLCCQKNNTTRRTIGIIGIVGIVLIGGVVLKEIATPQSRINTFFLSQSGNRVTDWQEAISGIKARPVFGWGPENYHVTHQLYFHPSVFDPGHGNEAWALHPHNDTLEVLVNGGIVGFIFYLLMLGGLFVGLYGLYRKGIIDGKSYALFTAMLIAFLIQQQMIYESAVSYTMFFFMIAMVAGFVDTTDDVRQLPYYWDTTAVVIGCVAIAVFFPIWLYGAYWPAQKVTELQDVAVMTSDQRALVYWHVFHSTGSYAIDTDLEFYTDPLFFSYAPQEQLFKSNPLYRQVASQEVAALIAAIDPIWQIKTYDYHLSLNLLELENLEFYLTNNPQCLTKADVYAARAFPLSPTDPQIYSVYGQTLVYENKIAPAEVLLRKAVALNPNYLSAANFLQVVQKQYGDQ